MQWYDVIYDGKWCMLWRHIKQNVIYDVIDMHMTSHMTLHMTSCVMLWRQIWLHITYDITYIIMWHQIWHGVHTYNIICYNPKTGRTSVCSDNTLGLYWVWWGHGPCFGLAYARAQGASADGRLSQQWGSLKKRTLTGRALTEQEMTVTHIWRGHQTWRPLWGTHVLWAWFFFITRFSCFQVQFFGCFNAEKCGNHMSRGKIQSWIDCACSRVMNPTHFWVIDYWSLF